MRARWQWLLDHLDSRATDLTAELSGWGAQHAELAQQNASVFEAIQSHALRVSWKAELREELLRIFSGLAFGKIVEGAEGVHKKVLRGRVFVALHMHAGDGNVHTNIPVNSDDYLMLQRANQSVARIMKLAKALGGVISGEHGIGITKMDYLEPAEIEAFRAYKQKIDPEGHFNAGKLLAGGDLANAYTPSFSLLGAESLILEQSDLGAINDSIKDCPALRQVQARMCHACPARQPAVLAPQQDPRHIAPDRGLPLRGADPARRVLCALRRVQRRGRPLHGLPQVRKPLSRGYRLRRRVDRDAQPLAPPGQAPLQHRHRRIDAVPERHRPAQDQARARLDDRVGL